MPWEGQYKVILILNLAMAIVPTERREGTESIVLMIDTDSQNQYIKGIVLTLHLKRHGLSGVFLKCMFC